ncbi:MAG: T9SS type A sorting domain-containing protein, partial [Ginsengibacter sp.]
DNIRIYPNPASDILQIDFLQNITGTISIQLSNSKGQVVYSKEIVIYGYGHIEKINVKHFAQGEYTLYLQRKIPGSGLYESQPAVYKIVKF